MPGCFHGNWCQCVSHPLVHRQRKKETHLLKQRVLKLYGKKEIRVSGRNNLELKSAVNPKASLHQHGLSWQSWALPALSCKGPGTARTWCLLWAFPALFCDGECFLDLQCYLCLCWEASESSQQWGSVSWETPQEWSIPWNAVTITGSCLRHF